MHDHRRPPLVRRRARVHRRRLHQASPIARSRASCHVPIGSSALHFAAAHTTTAVDFAAITTTSAATLEADRPGRTIRERLSHPRGRRNPGTRHFGISHSRTQSRTLRPSGRHRHRVDPARPHRRSNLPLDTKRDRSRTLPTAQNVHAELLAQNDGFPIRPTRTCVGHPHQAGVIDAERQLWRMRTNPDRHGACHPKE